MPLLLECVAGDVFVLRLVVAFDLCNERDGLQLGRCGAVAAWIVFVVHQHFVCFVYSPGVSVYVSSREHVLCVLNEFPIPA